jgi:nicotinic acetylcholine receptor
VTIMTKALVFYDGRVLWEPPALFNSMCQMNVRWFPFDIQVRQLHIDEQY